MSEHASIVRIKGVKHAFQELNDEVVYVGGAYSFTLCGPGC